MSEERTMSPEERQRELALHRYVQAVETGDLDAIAAVLALALDDPELDRQIAGVDEALHAGNGLTTPDEDAQTVRRLLLRHLPSAFPDEEEELPPLKVGDVAARLQADQAAGQSLAATDRLVNVGLVRDTTPLPTAISAATIAHLAAQLGVTASARYWERFRRAAVLLGLARERGQVELQAARRQGQSWPPARRARSQQQQGGDR